MAQTNAPSEPTTGSGRYRVRIVMEKYDPLTMEILNTKSFRGPNSEHLQHTDNVLKLTLQARDSYWLTCDPDAIG